MDQKDIPDLLDCFERWVLNPLKEDIQNKNRSHFNIFIVLAVAIDNLANIRYAGEIPKTTPSYVGVRYKTFINNYMPKYKSHCDLMYDGFRNKLVHAFQSSGIDIRDDDPSLSKHLTLVEHQNLCLHSAILLQDVLQAYETLKSEMIGTNTNSMAIKSLLNSEYKPWWRTPQNNP